MIVNWEYRHHEVWFASDQNLRNDKYRRDFDPSIEWKQVQGGAWVVWSDETKCVTFVTRAMNALGAKGWEIVAVYPVEVYEGFSMKVMYVLKRPATDATA